MCCWDEDPLKKSFSNSVKSVCMKIESMLKTYLLSQVTHDRGLSILSRMLGNYFVLGKCWETNSRCTQPFLQGLLMHIKLSTVLHSLRSWGWKKSVCSSRRQRESGVFNTGFCHRLPAVWWWDWMILLVLPTLMTLQFYTMANFTERCASKLPPTEPGFMTASKLIKIT